MDTDNKLCILRFDGKAAISNIQDIKDKLQQAIETFSCIEVDISLVNEFDMSLIQLLLSARRFASERQRRFVLSAPASGALRDFLLRSGLIGIPEVQAKQGAGFWTEGNFA